MSVCDGLVGNVQGLAISAILSPRPSIGVSPARAPTSAGFALMVAAAKVTAASARCRETKLSPAASLDRRPRRANAALQQANRRMFDSLQPLLRQRGLVKSIESLLRMRAQAGVNLSSEMMWTSASWMDRGRRPAIAQSRRCDQRVASRQPSRDRCQCVVARRRGHNRDLRQRDRVHGGEVSCAGLTGMNERVHALGGNP